MAMASGQHTHTHTHTHTHISSLVQLHANSTRSVTVNIVKTPAKVNEKYIRHFGNTTAAVISDIDSTGVYNNGTHMRYKQIPVGKNLTNRYFRQTEMVPPRHLGLYRTDQLQSDSRQDTK